MTTAIVWVYLYLIVCNCFQKRRKGVLDECQYATPLCFDASFLDNLCEYPHKLRFVLPETRLPAKDLYC